VSAGTITNSGRLQVIVDALANQGVIINTAGLLTLNEAGTIDNDGTIIAAGGTLQMGAVSGSGTIVIGNSSARFSTGRGAQTLEFTGNAGRLEIGAATGVYQVLGFSPGNQIELVGIPANVSFNNGTLTATNGPVTVAQIAMPGIPLNAAFHATVDGNLNTFITETIPCFAAGTRILGPRGEIAVEDLRIGDRVTAMFGGTVTVQWVGCRHVGARRHPRPETVWPIRIRPGALGHGTPHCDLWLSAEHAVLIDGVLVPIGLLVNGISIVREPVDTIAYFHIELPRHDVLRAHSVLCESYLDTGNRADFENGGSVVTAHSTFGPGAQDEIWRTHACAPQCRNGPRLTAIRSMLNRRAGVSAARLYGDADHARDPLGRYRRLGAA